MCLKFLFFANSRVKFEKLPVQNELSSLQCAVAVSHSSNFCHFLSIAGAPGVVVGDSGPGRGLLADEGQHGSQRSAHAVLEAAAQAHIEQRVEAAVEVGQAQRQRVAQVERRPVGRMARCDQVEEVHDVQRQPAQEEAQNHARDHPQRLVGAGSAAGQLTPTRRRLAVHNPVADGDDQEGKQEAHQEAVDGDKPGAEWRVHRHALPLDLARFDLLGVDELGDAAEHSQAPDQEAAQGALPRAALVLAPDGPADQQPAVHADEHQLQDAAEHQQVEKALDQRAGQRPKVPVVVVGQRHHEQGQRQAAEQVGQGQVQEPDGRDGTLHAEAGHPDHHGIPGNAQQDHQSVEEQRGDLQGLDLGGQDLRVVGVSVVWVRLVQVVKAVNYVTVHGCLHL